ncbi:MAG: hypothetical protein R3B97_15325 [Dehalococcoidia bacterium]|nr:hypothetical protein [Dehalococcoidia bacterium]
MKRLSLFVFTAAVAISGGIATQGLDAASAGGPPPVVKFFKLLEPIFNLLGSTWS